MHELHTIREVIRQQSSDAANGLDQQEVNRRRDIHGENSLKEGKLKTPVQMFLAQLNDPLIFVLFVAAALSMLLGEISDTLIIVAVIMMNAVVGVIQEGKAQKALEALKKLSAPNALVKREGIYQEIPASELVPGDIVSLDAGRQVPADIRLITAVNLKVDEAALTGESVPAEKDAAFMAMKELPAGDCKNMVYMSTNITYGRAEGIVMATGMDTEIGKIAGMINETKEESTPLQKRLADLGKLLSIVAVILCVLLFGIALLQKRDILEMLITAISLAVAAVPEGLPAVVTIVLALSVSRMVKVNTIIRKLPSVETLGAVSIVCSDKTGTLTQNKMVVEKCFVDLELIDSTRLDRVRHKTFVEGFVLCNDAMVNGENRIGDPTELALVDMGIAGKVSKIRLEEQMRRIKEIPFDSDRKMMTTLHQSGGQTVSFTKGSSDELLKRCTHIYRSGQVIPIDGSHRRQIRQAMESMAASALRVLALGMRRGDQRPQEKDLIFVGLVGMMDPPRPEAAKAIEEFKLANVKTVMITGDHKDTAFAIAKKLGIAHSKDECISGEELNLLSDPELQKKVMHLSVFARVSPEHKVRIVKALKACKKIVAMTGDGVNDAPSLKAADIGIAMGKNGTDVAKNASDIILADDNFATIEKAIEEGRSIYENIKKTVIFLLSSNFGEIITMFLAILAGFATPLKASHILWINLITDSLPALALGVDKNDTRTLMSRPPRKADENLFAGGGLTTTLFYGCLISFISLTAFLMIPYAHLTQQGHPITLEALKTTLAIPAILTKAQTYSFTVLGISQLFHAIGMRDTTRSVFGSHLFSNKLMLAAFAFGLLLQLTVTQIPYLCTIFGTAHLDLRDWINLLFLSSLPLVAHEIIVLLNKIGSNQPQPTPPAAKPTIITAED